MLDFATRAYNHNNNTDFAVRSLLDQDVYKFFMGQFIWKHYANVPVTFSIKNRTRSVNLARIINKEELIEQLDYVRTLRFKENELIWLQGNTFYGVKGIFCPEYIEFLRNFQLPEYELIMNEDNFELRFSGNWLETSMWEIIAIMIVNTMRNRALMKSMSKFDLHRFYNEAHHRLFSKLDYLKAHNVSGISDFGSRRRSCFLHHSFAVQACQEILKENFAGSSSSILAYTHGLNNVGSTGHEQVMVLATLANTDEELLNSPYSLMNKWKELYGNNLSVLLPDTFGSTSYFENAPEDAADWKAIRPDSKDSFVAGEEAIAFWKKWDRNPMDKMLIFADGLDHELIVKLHNHFQGKIGRIGFGFGTNLTNDFPVIRPISLVCKVTEANGKSAVKLSDNKAKRVGSPEEIARYVRVFGEAGMTETTTTV